MGIAPSCSVVFLLNGDVKRSLGEEETRNDQRILLMINSSTAIFLMLIVFVKVISCKKLSVLHVYVFDEFLFKTSKHGNICKKLVPYLHLLRSILN